MKDIVTIGDRKLFRGKILDDKRNDLLVIANILKSMRKFENVCSERSNISSEAGVIREET